MLKVTNHVITLNLEAFKTLWLQVRELEGQDMRETIQDKINQWFVENRNPETGEYPEFPDQDDGGSKVGGARGAAGRQGGQDDDRWHRCVPSTVGQEAAMLRPAGCGAQQLGACLRRVAVGCGLQGSTV